MTDKKYQITQAEWPIMEVLWQKKTSTAAEIVAAVSPVTNTSMRTVKTLIRRLVAKGAVSYTVDDRDTRVYHYCAEAARELCASEKADALLGTVFGKNMGDMLLGFLHNASLSHSDIEKLEQLLKEKKDELGKSD